MKCVLLAGGYGTRLGTMTKDIPKPMINIGGKPAIEHIIQRLNSHGIKDIIVNIHYLPNMISDYLQERVLYYYTPKLLGHEGTFKALQPWLEDDFLVINADTLTELNYTDVINFHQHNTITACMDEWRSIGTWIYCHEYFKNDALPIRKYKYSGTWIDIGTRARLKEAKEIFG